MLYYKGIGNIETDIMACTIVFETNVAQPDDKEFHGREDKAGQVYSILKIDAKKLSKIENLSFFTILVAVK